MDDFLVPKFQLPICLVFSGLDPYLSACNEWRGPSCFPLPMVGPPLPLVDRVWESCCMGWAVVCWEGRILQNLMEGVFAWVRPFPSVKGMSWIQPTVVSFDSFLNYRLLTCLKLLVFPLVIAFQEVGWWAMEEMENSPLCGCQKDSHNGKCPCG